MKNRISWIDVSKGVGMILVMFAHAKLPHGLRNYIYSFHIPLFFCISGYLFNANKYNKFMDFLKVKSKALLISYMFFSCFNYCFYLFFRNFSNSGSNNLIKPLVGSVVGIRDTEWTICNGTLWFVLVLYLSEILLYCIVKLSKDKKEIIIATLFLFSMVGYSYNTFIGVKLVWNTDIVLVAIVFVGFGYILKKMDLINRLDKFSNIIIFIILTLIFETMNTDVDMFKSIYGNYIYFYLAAISATIGVMIICKRINKSKVLEFIGKNTFVYLAVHQYIIYSFLNRIKKVLIPSPSDFEKIILAIFYVMFTIIILYIPIKLTNKYCPIIVGKSKERNTNLEIFNSQ
ncbi:acyltransferase family protein [Clostridium butyricum]|uniref:acyltransferase family protein n=1 Tax=Clostridium butyricum TaxID=1492 RepID=UPI0034669382